MKYRLRAAYHPDTGELSCCSKGDVRDDSKKSDDEWEMTVKAYDMEKVSRGFDSFWVCVEIEV